MLDWIIREWREQHLGVLIIGGQVMVAGGLREQTKDVDACLAAKQCPRMHDWLMQKEAQGHAVELRLGSAPIHPDWLGRGWTCHVQIDEERLDFFGVPLRASRRFVDRFLSDPSDVALASFGDLGNLKRTERLQDWTDIDLITERLREQGEMDALLRHLFGEALVAELEANRDRSSFREAIENSQQARERPILRLGLTAPLPDFHAMARAERGFWMEAGALRSQEITRTIREFWREHAHTIRGGNNFALRHAELYACARIDLPLNPVRNPTELIEAARSTSGVDRWPGLLPPTSELVLQYFPAYRPELNHRFQLEWREPRQPNPHEPEPG